MQIFAIVSGDFLMKLVWAWSYKVLKSTLVQVMAWYREAISHTPIQCWTKSMSPYGVTRPQWVKDWKVEYFIPLFSDLVPSSYLAHRWTCGHAYCCWYKTLIWPACERTDKREWPIHDFFLFLMIILSYCNHDTVVTPDLRLANRRRCYNVTLSPIGQVQCSK